MKLSWLVFILSMTEMLWPVGPTLQREVKHSISYADTYEASLDGYSAMSASRVVGRVVGVQDLSEAEEIVEVSEVAKLVLELPSAPSPIPTGISMKSSENSSEEMQEVIPTQTPSTTPTSPPSPTPSFTPQSDVAIDSQLDTSTLNSALNEWRSGEKKSSLSEHNGLCLLAHQRAMEAGGNFSHDGFFKLQEEGKFDSMNYESIAENLWTGDEPDPSRIVRGWSESEGHRNNMLGDFSHGCGAVVDTTAAFLFMKIRE